MSDMIGIEDLRPGDILLHRGVSFVSRGIQFFDGSPVSHASLYLGEGRIGEAAAKGLVENDYHDSFHGNEWVKAYRLVGAPADISPVLQVARRYLDQGNRYGFEQIFVLALLCTTRQVKITPVLRRLLRTLLDAAATALTALFRAGKEPMICSEFVYRVYDEVEAPDPAAYAIKIPGMLPLPQDAPAHPASMTLAAGDTAPEGRVVHPESLAALFGAAASDARLARPAAPMALAAPEAKPPSARALNRHLKTYLQDMEEGETVARRQTVSLEELGAATDRFVGALYQAKVSPAPSGALAAAPPDAGEVRSAAYQYLFRAAADFVTPRDLGVTPSLFLLGRVKT